MGIETTSTSPTRFAALALSLSLAALAMVLVLERPAAAPLNVLFVLVDALRADHLGCYGYELPTSPFTDELAKESAVFESTLSASSQTVPSILSLWSASYPSRHGNQFFPSTNSFREPKRGSRPGVPSDLALIAEHFRRRGFRTGAVVTNPWLRSD